MNRVKNVILTAGIVTLLSACASQTPSTPSMMVDNTTLPEAVRAPASEKQILWTVGVGEITYECRPKRDMAGQYEWAFVAPVATLKDASGKTVGKYYAGPTWEAADGSKVTGKQVAIAPAQPGSIPLQLVKAEPATGQGIMQNVTYIQRLKTQGGIAPTTSCTANNTGGRENVKYQADYVFYGR